MHVDAQAEHNKSQNTLFELSSKKEERETSRQHEAEQAATDLEEAHKKLRQVGPCKQALRHKPDQRMSQSKLAENQKAMWILSCYIFRV